MGRRMKSKGPICCIFLSLFCVCFAENVNLTVNGEISIAETDENFICATIDWWPATKCDFNQCPWANTSILNLDLENKILVNAVKAFSSLRLRLGGSLQDQVLYKVERFPAKCTHFKTRYNGLFGFSQGCLDMDRWHLLNKFFIETGALITFGLNALTGRKKSENDNTLMVGEWDSKNALEFMNYTVSNGYKIDSYELGNELSGDGVVVKVDAQQYGRDIIVLKNIINELYADSITRTRPQVIAPSGFFDRKWFDTFLNTSGPNVVDGLSHHIYNLGPGNDVNLINKIQDPNFLDEVHGTYREISSNITSSWPWTRAWVGEAGGAYTSGSKEVSHTFVNGFWYLDQLGITARYKHSVFCRQTLIGGNYGLLNTTSFIPNPDYYGALLWHRLMGKKVLKTSQQASEYLRAYSHCSKNTVGISVLMINMSNSTTFEVTVVDGNLYPYKGGNQREEYHLTPKDGNILSDVLLLNGTPLNLTESSDIPAMSPLLVNATSPITVAPDSIVFATLKGINVIACQ